MLRNAFWLALIAGALVAIAGGFAQGVLVARPPALVTMRNAGRDGVRHATPPPSAVRTIASHSVDRFSRDDVVVDRVRENGTRPWHAQRLAVVVGPCGYSLAAESTFLQAGMTLSFIVDPEAEQAAAFASLARAQRDRLFVQTERAPSLETIALWKRRLGSFDGIASRSASGMAAALRASGLTFFDERGTSADARAFVRAGVPLVRRDVTADDVGETGYVRFMLERAADLSRRAGTVVVLVRPRPVTLRALRSFAQSRTVRFVAAQAPRDAGT